MAAFHSALGGCFCPPPDRLTGLDLPVLPFPALPEPGEAEVLVVLHLDEERLFSPVRLLPLVRAVSHDQTAPFGERLSKRGLSSPLNYGLFTAAEAGSDGGQRFKPGRP